MQVENLWAYWPLGKVIEVNPKKDGHKHSAKLQVCDKQLIRPIVKLRLLVLHILLWPKVVIIELDVDNDSPTTEN